jgi:DNA-binding NtrC family response regulator
MRVPPLRERREDIPVLIDHFIKRFVRENQKKMAGITREAQDILIKYDYPGNVRELENIIERAVVVSRDSMITTEDLPFQADACSCSANPGLQDGSLHQALGSLERQMILDAMDKTGSNQTQAAKLLGLSERMLRYKLKKYSLK